MKQIGEADLSVANGIGQLRQSNEVSTASQIQSTQAQLPMRADPQGKKRIAEAVLLFHDSLKVYGKQPDQMESVLKLFHFALADYPVQKIVDAMAYYVRNYSEFPAPADIVQIIERGNKPPYDRAVYVAICKKLAELRTDDEWEYIEGYQKFMING